MRVLLISLHDVTFWIMLLRTGFFVSIEKYDTYK